jgi:hypothetical protein
MKIKKWLPWAALFLFLAVFIIRVIWVNTTYPEPNKYIVAVGETATSPRGLELTVKDAYFVPHDELAELFLAADNEHNRYDDIPGKEAELAVIELELYNPKDEEQGLDLPTNLESGAWTNGMDKTMFIYLNPGYDAPLMPRETKTFKLPFNVRNIHFRENQWGTVRERTYYLTLSLVPEIVKMELPYMGDQQ